MPATLHTYTIYIWWTYIECSFIYILYMKSHVSTRRTVHVLHKLLCYWHIQLNKYKCHITNTGHKILILYWHIDLTVAQICAKWNQLYMLLPYLCQIQICLPKCTHIPYIRWAYLRNEYSHKCNVWRHWHHPCQYEPCICTSHILLIYITE